MNLHRHLSSSSKDTKSQLKSLTIQDLEQSNKGEYQSDSISFTQETFSGVSNLLDTMNSTLMTVKSTLSGTTSDQRVTQLVETLSHTRRMLSQHLNRIQDAYEDLLKKYIYLNYKSSYTEMEHDMFLISQLYDKIEAEKE